MENLGIQSRKIFYHGQRKSYLQINVPGRSYWHIITLQTEDIDHLW
jgi:hypothetical protein